MVKDEKLYLMHIIEASERIKRYTAPGKDAFLHGEMIQDAVIKVLANLTESTDKITPVTKSEYPKIPWQTIKAFRNALVHDYLGDLELEEMWKIIHHDLPELILIIKQILKEKYGTEL